jgi:hypothetical protein
MLCSTDSGGCSIKCPVRIERVDQCFRSHAANKMSSTLCYMSLTSRIPLAFFKNYGSPEHLIYPPSFMGSKLAMLSSPINITCLHNSIEHDGKIHFLCRCITVKFAESRTHLTTQHQHSFVVGVRAVTNFKFQDYVEMECTKRRSKEEEENPLAFNDSATSKHKMDRIKSIGI